MSKEQFKVFVRDNPSLASHVNNNEISWQQLYEMYNLYGENSNVWNEYLTPVQAKSSIPSVTSANEKAFQELINMVRNVDLEKVRHGIEGVQKTISLVQDLGFGNSNNNNVRQEYQGRPLYQHFED